MHRALVISVARMVVQLVLVGYVLRLVFALSSPALTLAVIVLMALVAAREVAARPEVRFRGQATVLISVATVAATTALALLLVLATAIRPSPWWSPQYMIPLAGIILGSVLNSASLGLDHVLGTVARDRGAIEARLALGATFPEATHALLSQAVRRGVLPIINQMTAAGIVTLPGIMTGQILAGMDPLSAVKYQILLMLLLAGSSALAALLVASLALHRLRDERHRLRLDRLRG